MTREDWVRKLTSRKFWAAVAAFVTGLLIYFGKSEAEAAQVEGLILSGAAIVAYILGEGLIDAVREHNTLYMDEPEEKPPEDLD